MLRQADLLYLVEGEEVSVAVDAESASVAHDVECAKLGPGTLQTGH